MPSLALSASVKLADLITSAAAGHVFADLHIVIIGCFTGGEMPCMVLAHDELPVLMAADSELHAVAADLIVMLPAVAADTRMLPAVAAGSLQQLPAPVETCLSQLPAAVVAASKIELC